MASRISVGDIEIDVEFKDIKNVHLSVYPPTGRVRISAPLRMTPDTIRVFAISKLAWIRRQQKKLLEQERETPREFLERESHYIWGKRYLLTIIKKDAAPKVELTGGKMVLQLRMGTSAARKEEAISRWYREQLRSAVPGLVEKWEPILGVKVNRFFVQKMKTKWGGCNPKVGNIRLNTALATKPPEYLEYIIVHEMAHLLVPNHGEKFVGVLDKVLPNWRLLRQKLNEAPLSHEDWGY